MNIKKEADNLLTDSVTGEKTSNNTLFRDTNRNGFAIPVFIVIIGFISLWIVNWHTK